ncbi:hypothetical protein WMY93_005094 [Mugilogobius chulae]|uniref:BED-type domain-containing protein n=1 Tax=Mugilogobius chulae TaxID=88201 RepID=A0AAW0Q1I2_9GOBI
MSGAEEIEEENIPSTSSAQQAGETLIARRGSTSLAWKWFGFERTDVRQLSPICKICNKPVSVKSSSTTNLFHHLRTSHRIQYEEYERLRQLAEKNKAEDVTVKKKSTQLSLADSFTKKVPYERKSEKWQTITDSITNYLARAMLPIQSVEQDGFKDMVKTLDPRYSVPSRTYFSKTALPKLYESCRERLSRDVQNASFYSTTSDLWSSRTSEPYLSLTIHFISDDWRLLSYCLQTSYFPEDHTGELIAQGLKDALSSWSLKEERMACMTTDSGANVVRALTINNWQRLPCFGHRLHIAIERSMRDPRIDRALGVCKKIVAVFANSWKKKKALAKAQEQLNLPQHTFITECPTRWGSRQRMIERVLEQQKAIQQVLSADRKQRHLVPTWQDIEVLESISKALGPLLEFTDALSGEQQVTVSYVKPVLSLFNSEVLAIKPDDTELTKQIKQTILDYLNEKYAADSVDKLLGLASTLDPRFKHRYNSADKIPAIESTLKAELLGMLNEEENPATSQVPTADEDQAEEEEDISEPLPAKKTKKSFGSYFKKRQSGKDSEQSTVEKEMQSYLMIPEMDSDADPLEWWKTQEVNFPRLGKLAKKYLCIPASSSPSERAFSTALKVGQCDRGGDREEAGPVITP